MVDAKKKKKDHGSETKRVLCPYEFELGHNSTKAIKNDWRTFGANTINERVLKKFVQMVTRHDP